MLYSPKQNKLTILANNCDISFYTMATERFIINMGETQRKSVDKKGSKTKPVCTIVSKGCKLVLVLAVSAAGSVSGVA